MKKFNNTQPRTIGRPGVLLASGVVVALVAGWLTFAYVRSAAPTEVVAAATRDIQPFTMVGPNDIALEARPKAAVPKDALTTKSGTAGLTARGLLLKGDVIRSGYLSSQSGSALTANLATMPSLRVISLTPETMEGLSDQVSVGDRLDLLGVMQISNGKVNETRIGILASGVSVVAVTPRQANSSLGGGQNGGNVLIAVTANQAEAIKLAQSTGKVFVMLTVDNKGQTSPPVLTPEIVLPAR
jgi:Flp pilus assembly protein CpaB